MQKERRESVPISHYRTHISAEGVSGEVGQGSPLRRTGWLKDLVIYHVCLWPWRRRQLLLRTVCAQTQEMQTLSLEWILTVLLYFLPSRFTRPSFALLCSSFSWPKADPLWMTISRFPEVGRTSIISALASAPLRIWNTMWLIFFPPLVFDQMSPHPQAFPDCPC